MRVAEVIRTARNKAGRAAVGLFDPRRERFECPICDYYGPFLNLRAVSGVRKNALCPGCGSLERHRFQYVIVGEVLGTVSLQNLSMLHFAPEPFFREYFSSRMGKYETADRDMKDVDYNVDIQDLPFGNATYDIVFASHVLEHIPDDESAIAEIRRILRPGGLAFLPVPIVSELTIEYGRAISTEAFHVRAPGMDYFDRYRRHFSRVDCHKSDSYPARFQLHICEDRSNWPNKHCPLRRPMQGQRHNDIVPVCFA